MARSTLYVTKSTPPHAKTATRCVLGLLIRGTLSASAIVANERIPSGLVSGEERGDEEHTHGSHDLALQSKLLLWGRAEVRDSTTTIAADIRHLPDMVEDVARDEEQDGNDAARSPEVSVLEDG